MVVGYGGEMEEEEGGGERRKEEEDGEEEGEGEAGRGRETRRTASPACLW